MSDPSPAPTRAELRSHFPSLSGDEVFLDHAGGSQVPRVVADRIAAALTGTNAQLGGHAPTSRASARMVEAAHAWVGRWMGAPEESHVVVLAANASVLFTMLEEAVGRSPVEGRDEIVVGEAGHESNIGPWFRLEDRGYTVRTWRADPRTGTSDLDDLAELVTDRTRIVAVHHVSNLTGHVEDLPGIVRVAHARGAQVVCDGVAYAPHRAMRVADWGVDAYAFSLYKAFGPEMGALAATRSFLGGLDGPNLFFVPRDAVPYAFELGGASRMGCAAALAVGDYLAAVAGVEAPAESEGVGRATVERALARIGDLETPLTERLLADLRARPGVRVVGPDAPGTDRLPTVSFTVEGVPSATIARRAGEAGLGVRNGHFYAYRLAERMGLDPADGAVRVSLVHVNDDAELERWEAFLDTCAPRAT